MLKYPRKLIYSWKEPNNPSEPCCRASVTPCSPSLVEPLRVAVSPPRPPRRLADCCIGRPLNVAAPAPPRVALGPRDMLLYAKNNGIQTHVCPTVCGRIQGHDC